MAQAWQAKRKGKLAVSEKEGRAVQLPDLLLGAPRLGPPTPRQPAPPTLVLA